MSSLTGELRSRPGFADLPSRGAFFGRSALVSVGIDTKTSRLEPNPRTSSNDEVVPTAVEVRGGIARTKGRSARQDGFARLPPGAWAFLTVFLS